MNEENKKFLLKTIARGGYKTDEFGDWYRGLSVSDRYEARQLVDEIMLIQTMLEFVAGCEDQYTVVVPEDSVTRVTEAKSVLAKFTLSGEIK